MALRTTGHLLLGVVRIYSRKAKYLLADCNEAFIKIKMAFRPGAAVDLPEEGREANLNAITLPEVFHDFDSALPDFNDFEYQQQLTLNQSRVDDITMKEDVPTSSYNVQDDEFGGDGFDSLADMRDATDIDASVIDRANINHPLSDSRAVATPMPMDIDAPIMDDGFGGQLDDNLLDGDLNIFDEQFEGFDQGAIIRDMEFGIEDDEVENRRKTPKPTEIMSAVGKTTSTISENITEVTTLIQNENESFALEPLDATAATGLEKQRTKRKRRLIVDEVKAISGEDMKSQLNDYVDILTTLDLAPPTKKLMGFKETGGVDKLFTGPGLQFASKQLLKLLTATMAQRAKKEDATEPLADGALVLEDIDAVRGNAVSPPPRRLVSPIPEDLGEIRVSDGQPPTIVEDAATDDNAAEEFQSVGGLPSVSPQPQPTSPWAPGFEEPPSVLSAPASPRKERKSKVPPAPKDDQVEEDEEEADQDNSEEDKQWTKRTQQILGTVRNKLKNHDYVTFVDLCARKDNRKIAAQKFYTLLVLKKWRAIDVEQDEPYGEIRIKEGPRMNESLHV